MADDSASSKGVSRGGNGAVGSGSTKTSTGSVSKSSSSTKSSTSTKSTGSGSIGSKGGGASTQRAGAGSNSGLVSQSNLGAAKSSNQANRNKSTSGIGSGIGSGKSSTGSGAIGSKGGGASTQRPGAGGDAGKVSTASLARAEARTGMNRVQSTKNISGGVGGIASLGQDRAFGGFGPRSAFSGNYLSADQMVNTPTANLGSYVKDQSRVPSAVDPSLVGKVDAYRSYRPAPISTVGANSPLADTTTTGFSPFGGKAYDPLSSFNNNVAPVAKSLGASPAEVSAIGSLYGDKSLADVPTPGGRAFSVTQQPVSPAERVAAIGGGYDPLTSVSTYRAPAVAPNSTVVSKTETTSPPMGGWQAIGGARPGVVGSYPAAKITDQVPTVASYSPLSSVRAPAVAPTRDLSGVTAANLNDPYTNIMDKTSLPAGALDNRRASYDPLSSVRAPAPVAMASYNPLSSIQTPAPATPISFPRPTDVPEGGIQRISNPFATNIFSRNFPNQLQDMVTEGAARVQASRNPMVSQQQTVPDYNYSDQQGPIGDLPDPAAPTKQYIGPTYPGEENNFNGPTAYASNGRNPFVVNIPTSAPAPAAAPTTPTKPVDPTAPAPGTEWFKYYGTPQPYTTYVPTPSPVLMNPAPISQGAGSLLPRAVVVSPFG